MPESDCSPNDNRFIESKHPFFGVLTLQFDMVLSNGTVNVTAMLY